MRASPLPDTQFNEKKTTQAAARFLRLSGGRMNYMKLIKLLYMLDRESLLRWGRPVTFDEYYSMKFGPVLSEVHDLLTEMPDPEDPGFWSRHISEPARYSVALVDDPGASELSEAEEKLIDEICEKYGNYEPFTLVRLLHKTLPEWKEVESGRVPIEYADILKAGNKPESVITAIEKDLAHLTEIRQLFSPPAQRPLLVKSR